MDILEQLQDFVFPEEYTKHDARAVVFNTVHTAVDNVVHKDSMMNSDLDYAYIITDAMVNGFCKMIVVYIDQDMPENVHFMTTLALDNTCNINITCICSVIKNDSPLPAFTLPWLKRFVLIFIREDALTVSPLTIRDTERTKLCSKIIENITRFSIIKEMTFKTTTVKFYVPPNISECNQICKYIAFPRNKNSLSLQQISPQMTAAFYIGLLNSFEWSKEYIENFHKHLITGCDDFSTTIKTGVEIAKLSNFYYTSVLRDSKKNAFVMPQSYRYLMFWHCNVTMIKNIEYSKIEATFALRQNTMTKMLEELTLDFKINPSFVTSMKDISRVLHRDMKEIYIRLYKTGKYDHESDQEKRCRDYVGLMLTGHEMAAYTVIVEFLDTEIKTRAHILRNILNEIVIFEEMKAKIIRICDEEGIPILSFKLVHPGSDIITMSRIENLRYASIIWKAQTEKTWQSFNQSTKLSTGVANVIKESVTSLLKFEFTSNIDINLIPTARKIGIVVNDQGVVQDVNELNRKNDEDDGEMMRKYRRFAVDNHK